MKDRIVDAALELAEKDSWEGVRLHQIAQRLDISLDQVRQDFAYLYFQATYRTYGFIEDRNNGD